MGIANKNLTTHQEQCWTVYQRLAKKLGATPSVRAFAAELGVSHQSAHKLITRYRELRLLSSTVTQIRLKITKKGRDVG